MEPDCRLAETMAAAEDTAVAREVGVRAAANKVEEKAAAAALAAAATVVACLSEARRPRPAKAPTGHTRRPMPPAAAARRRDRCIWA